MASAEELARAYFEALDAADVERACELLAPDCEFVSPAAPMRGTEAIRQFLGGFASAFPDAKFSIDTVVATERTAAVEGHYTGTHTGALATPDGQEIPPTGRSVDAPYVTMFETDGERITSHRAYWDQLGFMMQLGLAPPG